MKYQAMVTKRKYWFDDLIPNAPRQTWVIILVEGMERFSYYGFRAILTLYLISRLNMSEPTAISVFALASSAAYASPVLGAYLSDGVIGKYYTILSLGSVYVLGLWCLVFAAFHRSINLTLVSLGLVSLGTGGIKSCVSSFGADQIRGSVSNESQEQSVRRFFALFYASINIGSILSFALIPTCRALFGYTIAFLVPAVFLFLAIFAFFTFRKSYIHCDIETSDFSWKMLFQSIGLQRLDSNENTIALRRVFRLLVTLPIFWMLYDQQASVWVIQAKKMQRHGIQPEQIGIANPIFILLLLPLFEKVIYPFFEDLNFQPTPARRIKLGMAFGSLAFFVAAYVNARAEHLHILWQLPQIFILSVAEILVSVTGLETSYAWAPPSLKTTVASAFLLTTAVGDAGAGIFYATLHLSQTKLLLLCAFFMLGTIVIFSAVVPHDPHHLDNNKKLTSSPTTGNIELQLPRADGSHHTQQDAAASLSRHHHARYSLYHQDSSNAALV